MKEAICGPAGVQVNCLIQQNVEIQHQANFTMLRVKTMLSEPTCTLGSTNTHMHTIINSSSSSNNIGLLESFACLCINCLLVHQLLADEQQTIS